MPMTCPSSRLPGTPAQVVIPALFTLIDVQPVDVLGGPSPVPEFLRLPPDLVEIEHRFRAVGILHLAPAAARNPGGFSGCGGGVRPDWRAILIYGVGGLDFSRRPQGIQPSNLRNLLPLDHLDGHHRLPSRENSGSPLDVQHARR